jgi:hypothetical protein
MAILRQASSPWQAIWALRLAGDSNGHTKCNLFAVGKRLPENGRRRNVFGLDLKVLAGSGVSFGAKGPDADSIGDFGEFHGFLAGFLGWFRGLLIGYWFGWGD